MRQIEHIRISKGDLSKAAAAALLALAICACGGGSDAPPPVGDVTAPTAVSSQAGPALTANAAIVIHFSESMNPPSLQVGGTLVADSNGNVWSKTSVDNDTLTLTPKSGGWTVGPVRTLNVDAKDLAGNALATLKASYTVNVAFDSFQAAAVVIGQAGFDGKLADQGGLANANTLDAPYTSPAVTTDGQLFIGDYANQRVLGYNSLPTANNANADFVLGQPDFSTDVTLLTSKGSHKGAEQVVAANGKLFVVDYNSHRVVIYNAIPTNGAAVQSVVVGQPDFNSSTPLCTNSSLQFPEAAAVTPDGKLIVADSGHHRVLIWNTIPTAHGQPASVVLGQFDATHCVLNDENHNDLADDANSTARTLRNPTAVWTDGTRLAVADTGNHRVLIWTSMPTSSFQPADLVLGQSLFTRSALNDDTQDGTTDAPTARTLNGPYGGIASNGVQFAVADSDNNRVLIWNSFPTSNFQYADVVLGQDDFSHVTRNDADQNGTPEATPTDHTLDYPSGLVFYRDKLLVTDTNNNRVLIFKSK